MVPESGIAAVISAGAVVGNVRTHGQRELAEFKEQLTVLFIGMLFVLLAADVRMVAVMSLGTSGAIVAALTVLVVRPVSVWIATIRAGLDLRARAFVASVGPRGIVAAAIASFFAYELDRAGVEGGRALRAMVFLVISASVLFSAIVGEVLAAALGLRRRSGAGWVVLGGSQLARAFATTLKDTGTDVVLIDNDPTSVRSAEEAGLRVLHGNALEPATLARAELDTRVGVVAVTTSSAMNLLFARNARAEVRSLAAIIAISSFTLDVTPEMVRESGGSALAGAAVDVGRWAERLSRGTARVAWWRFEGGRGLPRIFTEAQGNPPYLPLVHRRGEGRGEPVGHSTRFRKGSRVAVLVDESTETDAAHRLRKSGWNEC